MYLDHSAADRQQRFRNRRRADGLVELRVWVTPEQREQIKAWLAGEPGDGPAKPKTPPKWRDPRDKPVPPGQDPREWEEMHTPVVLVAFDRRPPSHVRKNLKQHGFRYDGKAWARQVARGEDPFAWEEWAERQGGTVTLANMD